MWKHDIKYSVLYSNCLHELHGGLWATGLFDDVKILRHHVVFHDDIERPFSNSLEGLFGEVKSNMDFRNPIRNGQVVVSKLKLPEETFLAVETIVVSCSNVSFFIAFDPSFVDELGIGHPSNARCL